jgi:uncharacterized protein
MNNINAALVRHAATAAAVHSEQCRAAPWPYNELDVASLLASGWRPTPIGDVILKVHQRCNLACSYCYVYTEADQSWRDRPAVMPEHVWRMAVARLAEHVRRNRLPHVRVILHGGEPLLFGGAKLGELVTEVRAALPQECRVTVGLQTNGVLLDAALMATMRRHDVQVGVSVDGVAAHHDRYRVTHSGRGTFAAVRAALDLLRRPENRGSYAGILCTVSPETDPVACYEQLIEFEPPMIDFLLPHANWQHPPYRPDGSVAPYADWLVAVFDRWYAAGNGTRVRLFEDIIDLLIGGASHSEQVGLSPAAMIVVESDGAIEQVDALKSSYAGACATGLDVFSDDFDTALLHPGVVARQIGDAALSAQCLVCPVVGVCGAGHYAHRYVAGRGFRNPSVYCNDMRRLIEHIGRQIATDISRTVVVGAAA